MPSSCVHLRLRCYRSVGLCCGWIGNAPDVPFDPLVDSYTQTQPVTSPSPLPSDNNSRSRDSGRSAATITSSAHKINYSSIDEHRCCCRCWPTEAVATTVAALDFLMYSRHCCCLLSCYRHRQAAYTVVWRTPLAPRNATPNVEPRTNVV